MPPWRAYQEEAATFFRSIGLEAETDATLNGARTSHAIDVVVRSELAGFSMLWLVECKQWKKRVGKHEVLALRQIVIDLGADRGILLTEKGVQSGAVDAARLTNVQITSLAALEVTASEAIGMAKLRMLHERLIRCRERYWAIDKYTRIDYQLRPEVGDGDYSGSIVADTIEAVLSAAYRGAFPISPDGASARIVPGIDFTAGSAAELARHLEPIVAEFEKRLDRVPEEKRKR
jgi:restriction system protein